MTRTTADRKNFMSTEEVTTTNQPTETKVLTTCAVETLYTGNSEQRATLAVVKDWPWDHSHLTKRWRHHDH